MFTICAGNELFFVALYLMKWIQVPMSESFDLAPNLITNLTWAELMAAVCLPICIFKNFINLIQLWKASKILVGVDLAERAQAREEGQERTKKR